MKRVLAVGVVLAVFATHGSTCLASVAYSSQFESSTAWNGFGAGFSPDWVGRTTVVKRTEETRQALDTLFAGATMCAFFNHRCDLRVIDNEPRYVQRWTVNKISSSAHAQTDVDTSFLLGNNPYSASSGDLTSESDSNTANLAHYAEIVTDDYRVLANASAVAYQNASFAARSFNASGMVSAATILKNGAASAESSAKGSSCFKTSYSLEKDTPFSFSLDLADFGDVDLAFSALNDTTGEVLWKLIPQSNELRHVEWSGILGAGQYSFALDALTDSLVDQNGVQNVGGQALYDVSLNFDAESYMVPSFATMMHEDWSTRAESHMVLQCGTLVTSNPAMLFASGFSTEPVPEPNGFVLLFAGLLSYLVLRCQRQRGSN